MQARSAHHDWRLKSYEARTHRRPNFSWQPSSGGYASPMKMLAGMLEQASNESCRLLPGGRWIRHRRSSRRLEDRMRGYGVEAAWPWDIGRPTEAIRRAEVDEVADRFVGSAHDRFNVAVNWRPDSTAVELAARRFAGARRALFGVTLIDGHCA
jgi:hypothetical protein